MIPLGTDPFGTIFEKKSTIGVCPLWYSFLKFALLTKVGVFEA
jgi:hypothetical protein